MTPYEKLEQKYAFRLEKLIKEEVKNNQDKYYIYSLLGRELMTLEEYSLAKKYYNKAIKHSSDIESKIKAEAYYNLMFINFYKQQEPKKLKVQISKIRELIGDENERVNKILNVWEEKLEKNEDIDDEILNSFYGAFYTQDKIATLINNKKFKKALTLLPQKKQTLNINYKIQYDILHRLVLDKKDNYLCNEMMTEFPKSQTYTMLICKFLKIKIHRIKTHLKRESPKRLYLISALQEIE